MNNSCNSNRGEHQINIKYKNSCEEKLHHKLFQEMGIPNILLAKCFDKLRSPNILKVYGSEDGKFVIYDYQNYNTTTVTKHLDKSDLSQFKNDNLKLIFAFVRTAPIILQILKEVFPELPILFYFNDYPSKSMRIKRFGRNIPDLCPGIFNIELGMPKYVHRYINLSFGSSLPPERVNVFPFFASKEFNFNTINHDCKNKILLPQKFNSPFYKRRKMMIKKMSVNENCIVQPYKVQQRKYAQYCRNFLAIFAVLPHLVVSGQEKKMYIMNHIQLQSYLKYLHVDAFYWQIK